MTTFERWFMRLFMLAMVGLLVLFLYNKMYFASGGVVIGGILSGLMEYSHRKRERELLANIEQIKWLVAFTRSSGTGSGQKEKQEQGVQR
jgi:hypothetical protein